eukprot:Tamp_12699.p1 GENE.Tamp_12699~~Tamp_12699.p1  ORF type:complete len:392 (+),score=63.17 Tamp_12699:36-1178(+)
MDQQSMLASLVQLNVGTLAQSPIVPTAGAHMTHGMSSGLAASPCFSAPGLTLQGFQGSSVRGPHQPAAPLLADSMAALQTLLNAPPQPSPSMATATPREAEAHRPDAGAAATFLAAQRVAPEQTDHGGAAQAAMGEAASAQSSGKLELEHSRSTGSGKRSGRGAGDSSGGSSSSGAKVLSGTVTHGTHVESRVGGEDCAAGTGTDSCSGLTESETDKMKLAELTAEHDLLKRRLRDSEAELERLRDVVLTLKEKKKDACEDKSDTAASSDKEDAPRRYWLQEEHDRFLDALQKHGPKAMKAISEHVATRTPVQVRTHAQKYFQRLARISTSESAKRRSGAASSSETQTHASSSDTHTDDTRSHLEEGGEGSSGRSCPRRT